MREDQSSAANKLHAERARLQTRLTTIHNRMDTAYGDKLDGKLPEDFWEWKMADWRAEEQQVKLAIDNLAGVSIATGL